MTDKAIITIEVVEPALSSSQFQEQAPQQDAPVDESSTRVEEKDTCSITTTDKEKTSEKASSDQLDGTTSSAAAWLVTVALALSFFLTGLVSE
jgi:hypothetical protein